MTTVELENLRTELKAAIREVLAEDRVRVSGQFADTNRRHMLGAEYQSGLGNLLGNLGVGGGLSGLYPSLGNSMPQQSFIVPLVSDAEKGLSFSESVKHLYQLVKTFCQGN